MQDVVEGERVEIVEKMDARRLGEATGAGHGIVAKLRQRLAAEARAADPENDDIGRVVPQPGGRFADRGKVFRRARHAAEAAVRRPRPLPATAPQRARRQRAPRRSPPAAARPRRFATRARIRSTAQGASASPTRGPASRTIGQQSIPGKGKDAGVYRPRGAAPRRPIRQEILGSSPRMTGWHFALPGHSGAAERRPQMPVGRPAMISSIFPSPMVRSAARRTSSCVTAATRALRRAI